MADLFTSVTQLLTTLSENTSINISVTPKQVDEKFKKAPERGGETKELLERLEHILDAARAVVGTMKNHV